MELTPTFMAMLEEFRAVFTSPSYSTFCLMMTGWILSVRHRYVTDLIISSDSVWNGHFSDYHRFFSKAKWNIDSLWQRLATLLVAHLIGPDALIILAGDDTLCRKRGLGLFGAGMHHDPLISSRAMKLVSWGHDWVTLCLIVANPWWAPSKVFALPICMRLYRNKQGVTKRKSKAKGGSKKPELTELFGHGNSHKGIAVADRFGDRERDFIPDWSAITDGFDLPDADRHDGCGFGCEWLPPCDQIRCLRGKVLIVSVRLPS